MLSRRAHARVEQHVVQSRKGGQSASRAEKSAFQRRRLEMVILVVSGEGGFAEQFSRELYSSFLVQLSACGSSSCHHDFLPSKALLVCLPKRAARPAPTRCPRFARAAYSLFFPLFCCCATVELRSVNESELCLVCCYWLALASLSPS